MNRRKRFRKNGCDKQTGRQTNTLANECEVVSQWEMDTSKTDD